MLGRFIRSAVETIRPAPIKIGFVKDLRRSTFEPGGVIDVVVEVTPKNKAAHVVEASVSVVLEFEIVRISTVMIPDRKANQSNFSARGGPVMIPKTHRDKSVDIHPLDTAVFLSETVLQPDRVTFPVRLSVPDELPRSPSNTVSSEATWKLVARVRLTDGKSYSAEQVLTQIN